MSMTYADVSAALPVDARGRFAAEMAAAGLDDDELIEAWEGWRRDAGLGDGVIADADTVGAELFTRHGESRRAAFRHQLSTLFSLTPAQIATWERWRARAWRPRPALTFADVESGVGYEQRGDFLAEMQLHGVTPEAVAAYERWRALAAPGVPPEVLAAAQQLNDYTEQRIAMTGVDADLVNTTHSHPARPPASLTLSAVTILVRYAGVTEGPLPTVVKHKGPHRDLIVCADRPYWMQAVVVPGEDSGKPVTRLAVWDMGVSNVLDPNRPDYLATDPVDAFAFVRGHRVEHGAAPQADTTPLGAPPVPAPARPRAAK